MGMLKSYSFSTIVALKKEAPGINVLPGSFMTGQIQWAYRGGIAAVAGAALLFFAGRRK